MSPPLAPSLSPPSLNPLLPHHQEPDAARTQADDNKSDPDFGVSKGEMAAADRAAAEQPGAGESLTALSYCRPVDGCLAC